MHGRRSHPGEVVFPLPEEKGCSMWKSFTYSLRKSPYWKGENSISRKVDTSTWNASFSRYSHNGDMQNKARHGFGPIVLWQHVRILIQRSWFRFSVVQYCFLLRTHLSPLPVLKLLRSREHILPSPRPKNCTSLRENCTSLPWHAEDAAHTHMDLVGTEGS